MHRKAILIPPCPSYGDCLSVIGLAYYLLNYYNKLYFCINFESMASYYRHFFSCCPMSNRIIIYKDCVDQLLNSGEYGDFHICNTSTGSWKCANTHYREHPNIDTRFYFNDLNPLYNQLDIPKEHRCEPNIHLPIESLQVNHLVYYKLIGLNNTVRMDYFNYVRNPEKEEETKNRLLKNADINSNEKYCIINNPLDDRHLDNLMSYKYININNLAETTGYLLSLIEGAESIHLIESLNTNFLYHCQYKGVFNYDGDIYFHVWKRDRNWPLDEMKLDYSWKMMDTPRLSNWKFIFNKSELVLEDGKLGKRR